MDKPNVEVRLKDKVMPRNDKGDVEFHSMTGPNSNDEPGVMNVFTTEEVVALVNRAIYQLEYQRESHRKRGQEERAKHKLLRETLKAQGKDVKAEDIARQLKGERD